MSFNTSSQFVHFDKKKGVNQNLLKIESSSGLKLEIYYAPVPNTSDIDIFISSSQNASNPFPKTWYEYKWNGNRFESNGKVYNNLNHITFHPNVSNRVLTNIHFKGKGNNRIEKIVGPESNKFCATYCQIFHVTSLKHIEYVAFVRNYSYNDRMKQAKSIIIQRLQDLHYTFKTTLDPNLIPKIKANEDLFNNPSKYINGFDKREGNQYYEIQKDYPIRLSSNFMSIKMAKQYFPDDFEFNCIIIGSSISEVIDQPLPEDKRIFVGFFN